MQLKKCGALPGSLWYGKPRTQDVVYSIRGGAPTLKSRDYKGGVAILVRKHETDRVYGENENGRTLKATDYKNPLRVMELKKIGNWLGHNGGNFAGAVFDKAETSPTLRTPTGGNTQVSVITEAGGQYRVRRLTPKEYWRLMGIPDSDFEKAAAVNSNTQLYKQAGNGIVLNCLVAIFRELLNSQQINNL